MNNKTGVIVAVFDKEGKKGYRIRDNNGEEDWYLLNEKNINYYNPNLKNKIVEYNFILEKEGKKDKKVLIFIKEEGIKESIKEESIKPREVFSKQYPNITQHNEQHQSQQYTDEERREMARSFAAVRYHGLDIALQLYPTIKSLPELIEKSHEIEEYIKSGMLK